MILRQKANEADSLSAVSGEFASLQMWGFGARAESRPDSNGEVAEWLKALPWKGSIPATVSRVRIPPSPHDTLMDCITLYRFIAFNPDPSACDAAFLGVQPQQGYLRPAFVPARPHMAFSHKPEAVHHTALEYVSFICLLGSLFVISGG